MNMQDMNTQFNKAVLCFTMSLEYLYTTRIQLSGKNNVLIKFLSTDRGEKKKPKQNKHLKQSKSVPGLI